MTWLVRHGESTWNAAGLLQGSTHAVGLTERGRAQAVAAAAQLRGLLRGAVSPGGADSGGGSAWDAYSGGGSAWDAYSGDGSAGGAPAGPVGAGVAGVSATRVLTSPQVRARETAEILADHLGLSLHVCPELREQSHGVWEGQPAAPYAPLLAAAGPDWAPPGGETFRALCARVRGVDLTGAVVVTHGETIRALLSPDPARPRRRIPHNGEVLLASATPAWSRLR